LKSYYQVFLLLLTLSAASFTLKTSATSTTIAVDPSTSTATVGETFSININVTDVTNLTCWEFKLYFRNDVLNCTAVSEGPFLKSVGSTFFNKTILNNYNTTHGQILAYSTLLGPVSISGSGVIATITFKAIGVGDTLLDLTDTKLGDEKIPPQPIPHTTTDGTATVTAPPHDLSITSIAPHKTVVGKGNNLNITASVLNEGSYAETFNITFYANTTLIGTETINNLAPSSQKNITITWNTSGFSRAWMISANVTILPGETDIDDNELTYGIVKVSCIGDVNGDYKTDIKDYQLVKNAIPSTPGSPNWNPNYDVNDDYKIDIKDYQIVKNHIPSTDP
jgi:hypothetical protein